MTECTCSIAKDTQRTELLIHSIDGVLINFCGDNGPTPIHNNSSLTEEEALKLGVIGTTMLAVGMDFDTDISKLYGPLPVPVPGLEAIAIAFRVIVPHATDIRIMKNGAVANIWIIFNSKYREIILFHFAELEFHLKEIVSSLEDASSLLDPDLTTKILISAWF